jgi:hypothetical protein
MRTSEAVRKKRWQDLEQMTLGWSVAIDIDKHSDYSRSLVKDCVDLFTGSAPTTGIPVITGVYRGIENESIIICNAQKERLAIPKEVFNDFKAEPYRRLDPAA